MIQETHRQDTDPVSKKRIHKDKRMPWRSVLKAVCKHHGLPVSDILDTSNRYRHVCLARRDAVCHIIRLCPHISVHRLSTLLGFDNTSVRWMLGLIPDRGPKT